MKTLYSILLLLISTTLFSQPVQWAKQSLSEGAVSGIDLITDEFGNTYVAGDHTEPTSFDDITIDNDGWGTMFVTKYNPDGEPEWSRSVRGNSNNAMRCITYYNGTIFVSGSYQQTNDLTILDFGEFAIEGGIEDNLFLAAIDADGVWQWVQTIQTTDDLGPSQITSPEEMIVLPDGRLILAGYCEASSVNIDGTVIPTNEDGSLFFASYMSDGTFSWFKTADSGILDEIELAYDATGIYFGGDLSFQEMVYDGQTLLDQAGADENMLVGKITPAGNLLWWWPAGNFSGIVTFGGLDMHPDGNLRVSIRTSGFDGVTINGTEYEANGVTEYVFLVNAESGVSSFYPVYSGWASFIGAGLAIEEILNDPFGNTYVTGRLESPGLFGFRPVFFGDTIGMFGSWESFISAYDSTGAYLGVFPLSFPVFNDGETWVTEMRVNNQGELIVTGFFEEDLTIGEFDLDAEILDEMFVFKLDPTQAFGTVTSVNEISQLNSTVYPNPCRDHVNLSWEWSSGSTEIRLIDLQGRLVQSASTQSNKHSLNLEGLENGSYVVTVQNQNGISQKVIVKQ